MNLFQKVFFQTLQSFDRQFHYDKMAITKETVANAHQHQTIGSLISLFAPINPCVIDVDSLNMCEYIRFRFMDTDITLIYFNVINTRKRKCFRDIVSYVCKFIFIAQACKLYVPQNLTIVLAPFLKKKSLPSTHASMLTEEHMNGGMVFYHSRNLICVYRKEELFKVLLHELFHACHVDKSLSNSVEMAAFEDMLIKKHHIRTTFEIRVSECYNDTICILWAIAIKAYDLLKKHTKKVNFRTFVKQYNMVLNKTNIHMLQRVAIIMNHFDILPMHNLQFPSNTYIEKSHAFAYYICKAAVFFHLPLFISWMQYANDMKWGMTCTGVGPYLDFLYKCISEPRFWSQVAVYMNCRSRSLRMIDFDL